MFSAGGNPFQAERDLHAAHEHIKRLEIENAKLVTERDTLR